MAKNKGKGSKADPVSEAEQGVQWPPFGIEKPLVRAEGGHEGARAVYEYCYHTEGMITEQPKFRDYDAAIEEHRPEKDQD